MANKCCNKDQIIKFLANTETQPSYAAAVELLSRKNLLFAEPAVAKYKASDGTIKMLMAIGADNSGTEILFIHETPESIDEVITMIDDIQKQIGTGSIDSSVGGKTNLIDAINWLNSKTDNNFTNEYKEKLISLADIKSVGAGLNLTPEGVLINTGGTGGGSIDDSSTSYATTWSSMKISNEIQTKVNNEISNSDVDGGSIDGSNW